MPAEFARTVLRILEGAKFITGNEAQRLWEIVSRNIPTLTPDTITSVPGGLETARELVRRSARFALREPARRLRASGKTCITTDDEDIVRCAVEKFALEPTKRVRNEVVLPNGVRVWWHEGNFTAFGEKYCYYKTANRLCDRFLDDDIADDWQPRILALKTTPTITVPASDPREAVE